MQCSLIEEHSDEKDEVDEDEDVDLDDTNDHSSCCDKEDKDWLVTVETFSQVLLLSSHNFSNNS